MDLSLHTAAQRSALFRTIGCDTFAQSWAWTCLFSKAIYFKGEYDNKAPLLPMEKVIEKIRACITNKQEYCCVNMKSYKEQNMEGDYLKL